MARFANIIFFILVTAISTQQVQAQPAIPFIQLAANQQNLDAAVQRIKQQTGGRILSAKTVTKNGQTVHHIKVLLPSGKVRVFKVK